MNFSKILTYKNHTRTIFKPIIDLKLKTIKNEFDKNSNVIITLTSYSERLNDIKYTLYSLFSQNLKPQKIVLYLEYGTKIPETLSIFVENGLNIEFCEDIGSYTKLIPALKKYANYVLVTADDDIYYPSDWLEKLYNSYQKTPSEIHCHRAHLISFNNNEPLPYEKWEKHISNVKSSYKNFLTGVGGVLYPPNCFSNEIFNQTKFLTLAPHADDIWFWAMAILNNRKICVVDNNIKNLKVTNILRQLNFKGLKTLYAQNKNGGNDKQLLAILKEYPEIKNMLMSD